MRFPRRSASTPVPGWIEAIFGAFVVVLCSSPALAQPRGDFSMWAEERQERWGPFGETRNWEGSRVHGEGLFFPVNAGKWRYLVDASQRGQELRFEGRDIPSKAGKLSIDLGDFVEEDPREDALRPEFEQAVWLRGAGVRLERENISYGLRAGTLTRRQGLFGWGRAATYSNSFGASVDGKWGESGLWKADWDRQEATQGRSGEHLARIFFGVQPVEGWSWLGQVRLSRLDDGRWGNSVVAGGRYSGSQFVVSGHLRRVAPDFMGLGLYTDPHANEWGGRLELHYSPRRQVRVGTSWDIARDIEPRYGLLTPEKRLVSHFFAAAPIAGPLSVRANMGYRNRTTTNPDSLLVDQDAIFWSSALTWYGRSDQAASELTRTLYRDPTTSARDWVENRVLGRYMHIFGPRVRGEVQVWHTRRFFLDGRWASTERKLETQWYWDPRPYQRGWIRVGRAFQDASDVAFARDQWETALGWTQPLPWDLSLDLESLFFIRADAFASDRTRWSVRVSRKFSLGGGRVGVAEALPEFGTIRGRVYEDLNGNGYIDDGESGIPGQPLRLGSGAETETDENGYYEFPEAATVAEWVMLDVARLPTRYLAPAEDRITVNLSPGEEVTRHFAVAPAASVGGRVVVDYGDHAEGLGDVLIRIPGTHHDVFTDAEGRFWIPGLRRGTITLEIVEWSLPKDVEPEGPRAKQVVLGGAGTTYAGVFVLNPRERNVIQIFRPGSR